MITDVTFATDAAYVTYSSYATDATNVTDTTLVDFYYGFHEKFEDYCTGIGWYNSIRHGNPIIHSTIGVFDVATIQKAQEIIFKAGIFGEAKITLYG